tara:strand:- start:5 stop:280 length:276 start_codon:yes stop_codon:yes gene_type:complete
MSNIFTVEHYKHGIGTAILIKNRRNRPEDLFMCSFKGTKDRFFFCRKHIDEGEELWWSDGKVRKVRKQRKDSPSLEDAFRSLFGSGDRINF